jgi:hypothetical protein
MVAQVCEKLAAAPVDFEVTLTGEGNLRIRPIRQRLLPWTFEGVAMKPGATKRNPSASILVQ